ncbi:glycosyl hydrolase [Flavihumibacter sp. R14]|nr:glycosyl hydrolase [Flavihumibacter soli]
MNSNIKAIALYLPQYHPIPENDLWWGKGFTEWTNVANTVPLFKNHYQPHIPADFGFYDLRLPDIFQKQVELAQEYNIYGFCFYHYWFNGKLLLQLPIENWLKSKKPDFPFCLSWANENWTRQWDGQEKDILLEQKYNEEDDYKHIQYLLPFFQDERYIKIEGKPVFLMYRSELHPHIVSATNIWREAAKKAGFPDLYLIRMENFERNLLPSLHGFDAGMEFAPDGYYHSGKITKKNILKHILGKGMHNIGIKKSGYYTNKVYSYPDLVDNMLNKPDFDYKYYRCVSPSWDNSARRKKNATVYLGSTPEKFGQWVNQVKQYTLANFDKEEQIFFINAWNEWGEGCHLEPDLKNGHDYLKAFKKGIEL